MRIAVFHNSGAGGARRFLYMHVRELVARGHEVRSWCFSTAPQDYLPMRELVEETIIACDLVPYGPPTRKRLQRLRLPEARWRLDRVEQSSRVAIQSIEAFKPDVLLLTNCMLSSVPPLARMTKLPVVLVLHEPWRSAYEAGPDWPWLGKQPLGKLSVADLLKPRALLDAWEHWRDLDAFVREEAANVKACGRVLVNSYFSRENTKRCLGVNATVTHHGVDADFFTPEPRERSRTVLGVGAFGPHKNAPLVIEALATIPAERRPRLIWVGGGGSRNFEEGLVQLAALRQVQLEIRRMTSDSDLRELYRTSGVLVFVPWLEPFGLVPLEANACGLPSIVMPEGGLRETCANGVNSFFVNEDISEIGRSVLALLDDPVRRDSLGRSARAWVESKWTVRASADRLEVELRKCAGKIYDA